MKNKDRYQLSKLKAKFSVTCNGVELYDGDKHIAHLDDYDELFRWLEQDCSPLTDKEREYLKAVIKPWRAKVKSIAKKADPICLKLYISIRVINESSVMLPLFMHDTMYKGMELGKEYSLDELGI